MVKYNALLHTEPFMVAFQLQFLLLIQEKLSGG